MPKLWVTYAWGDNENEDVDFYIAKLREQGLDVHFDRRALAAGRIMWEEFANAIADLTKCDAWLGICSTAALGSARWREEMFYALDRALNARQQFPMMFLVLGETPADMPQAARIRLYVSNHENDWAEKIAAGARGEPAPLVEKVPAPLKLRAYDMGQGNVSFELTLRQGTWPKWWVAEPAGTQKIVSVSACAPGTPRTFGMSSITGPHAEKGRSVWHVLLPAISPSMSAYVTVSAIPDALQLGRLEGEGAFEISGSVLRAVPVEACP